MTKLHATTAVVERAAENRAVSVTLAGPGIAMVRKMTEQDALNLASEIIGAVAANRKANGDQQG